MDIKDNAESHLENMCNPVGHTSPLLLKLTLFSHWLQWCWRRWSQDGKSKGKQKIM